MFRHAEDQTVEFQKVWNDELDAIHSRRRHSEDDEAKDKSAYERARESQLVGLALSGGGIRSATFCVGVLQSLASFGYLRRIDYLSTVSGGGYIGSWLTAWCRRCGGIFPPEKMLEDKASCRDVHATVPARR